MNQILIFRWREVCIPLLNILCQIIIKWTDAYSLKDSSLLMKNIKESLVCFLKYSLTGTVLLSRPVFIPRGCIDNYSFVSRTSVKILGLSFASISTQIMTCRKLPLKASLGMWLLTHAIMLVPYTAWMSNSSHYHDGIHHGRKTVLDGLTLQR